MTPDHWARLQHFDAACRCLMLLDPSFGVGATGVFMGQDVGLRKGWNRIIRDQSSEESVLYTRIGEEEGETTSQSPAMENGSIRTTKLDALPLTGSRLWSFMSVTSSILVADGLRSQNEVESLISSFLHASGNHFDTSRMISLWNDGIQRMRTTLYNAANTSGGYHYKEYQQPATDIVEAYLSFQLPGTLASEVLGALLSAQCIIPELWPAEKMPRESRISAIKHLAELIWYLVSLRDTMDVIGFYDATYLAGLYARTACRLISWARVSGCHSSDELDQLGKTCLNMDEVWAHRIAPVFILPSILSPYAVVERVVREARFQNESVQNIADYYQLHPALREILENFSSRKMTAEEVNVEFKRRSDAARQFSSSNALRGDAAPSSPENTKSIILGFLALYHGF